MATIKFILSVASKHNFQAHVRIDTHYDECIIKRTNKQNPPNPTDNVLTANEAFNCTDPFN